MPQQTPLGNRLYQRRCGTARPKARLPHTRQPDPGRRGQRAGKSLSNSPMPASQTQPGHWPVPSELRTIKMTSRDESCYQQSLKDGFCIFENVVDSDMLAALRQRPITCSMDKARKIYWRQRTTGSMFVIMQHPFFADIITYRPALDALARLGYGQPTFTDGYIISKPAHSPRLFWHYDWVRLGGRAQLPSRAAASFPHDLPARYSAAKTAACA